MATNFDTEFQDGTWPAHEDWFGESVDYTPFGGSSTAITAVWEPGDELDELESDGKQFVRRGRLSVDPDALSSWTPDTRDTAVIRSVTYSVESVAKVLPIVELVMVNRTLRRIGGDDSFRNR